MRDWVRYMSFLPLAKKSKENVVHLIEEKGKSYCTSKITFHYEQITFHCLLTLTNQQSNIFIFFNLLDSFSSVNFDPTKRY